MTRFPDEVVAEIKSRCRLSELIGRTVKLKKVGADFKGLSPFSNEKTPSFYVHDRQGFYKCFSTQKSGDCITWLMEVGRLTFTQAVEQLAEETGVQLTPPTPEESEAARRRARIMAALEWANGFFQRALFWSERDLAAHARDYVRSRGVTVNRQVTAMGLGWASPSWEEFRKVAVLEGHPVPVLIEAGLAREGEDKSLRCFFSNRLTFPITDAQGRCIGFTARALRDDQQPKYLNSPETLVFHKGQALYGQHEAHKALARGGNLYVVEGTFDAFAMNESHLAAVAPLGTAVTDDQLRVLWRMDPAPTFVFDGDDAGRRAARLAAERALRIVRHGHSLRFMLLPEGKDPHSIWQDSGPLSGELIHKEAISHFILCWNMAAEGLNLKDPGDRGQFRQRVRELLVTIDDKDVARDWRAAFQKRFEDYEPKAPPIAPEQPRRRSPSATREARAEKRIQLEEPELTASVLLGALWDAPDRVDRHMETLAGLPCGRFAPLRDWLMEPDAGQMALLEPWAEEQVALLRATGAVDRPYSPEGWERAAKLLAARYPSQ